MLRTSPLGAEHLALILVLIPVLGLTPILGLTFASSYSDPVLCTEKASILRENRGKSGIYMWKNKVNGKTYVGSSVDLTKRLRNYFNTSYLSDLKHIMLIYKALLALCLFLQTSG